jgi:hypothetical protein
MARHLIDLQTGTFGHGSNRDRYVFATLSDGSIWSLIISPDGLFMGWERLPEFPKSEPTWLQRLLMRVRQSFLR